MGSFMSSAAASTVSSSESSKVQAIHSASEWRNHLDSIKGSSGLMVIDFTATWCGPCKFIEPAFVDFSMTYPEVIFVKIDVDELQEVAQEYSVQAMPTFVLVKRGNQVDKVVGAKKDELRRKIEMHMKSP